MRIVIDVNVYVSGTIFTENTPAKVIDAWRTGRAEVVISDEILNELHRTIYLPKLFRYFRLPSDERRQHLLDDLRRAAIHVSSTLKFSVVERDPDDNRVLEAAVAGEADYVVTGDKDLLELRQFRGIQIMTPAQFVAILETMPAD